MTTDNPSAAAPAAPAGNGKRRSSPLRLLIPALILIGAGIFGWRWWQHQLLFVTTDNAQLNSDVLPVGTQLSGQVLEVLVRENEQVEAGQLLIRLDPQPFEIRVRQAEAQLHVARQQAATADAAISVAGSQARASGTSADGSVSLADAAGASAEAVLGQAQAARDAAASRVTELAATFAQSQTDYDRSSALAAAEIISRQELDRARTALDTASARLQAAREDLQSAEASVSQARAGIEQAAAQQLSSQGVVQGAAAARNQVELARAQADTAQAQVEVAEAALAQAQLDLQHTEIHAQRGGRVGRRNVEPGQQISPGQNLLAIVPADIWVEANFKETQMRRLHPQQSVEIIVDALPDQPLTGTVDSFSPASGAVFSLIPPENATGNFTKVVQRIPVRIRLDEASLAGLREQLTPGMSCVVHVRAS